MERLGTEYRNMVNACFDSGDFPWAHSIAYGELTYLHGNEIDKPELDYGLDPSTLELDGKYDISALGAAHGRITLFLHDEEVSIERTAQLLLSVKNYLDSHGIPFHGIHFSLCQPLNEAGQNTGNRITLIDFLYDDIYERDLTQRVKENWNTTQKFFSS